MWGKGDRGNCSATQLCASVLSVFPFPGYSHVLHTLGRLFQAVPADEVVVNLSVFDASIWCLPTSHDLPHGHSKGPLGV